jgi:general secretion pathway protein I
MSPCNTMRPRQRGFTLIEVLVALAIVALGMAAVLSTLTSSASTVLYLHDKTLAQWIALNHIAEQRLTGQQSGIGNTDGDVDYAGQKWHWRQETVATAIPNMVRMDVMVRPADSKDDNDHGWYVTLSGIEGDMVGIPSGTIPMWDPAPTGPGGNNTPGNGQPTTPATPGTPPTTPATPPKTT